MASAKVHAFKEGRLSRAKALAGDDLRDLLASSQCDSQWQEDGQEPTRCAPERAELDEKALEGLKIVGDALVEIHHAAYSDMVRMKDWMLPPGSWANAPKEDGEWIPMDESGSCEDSEESWQGGYF